MFARTSPAWAREWMVAFDKWLQMGRVKKHYVNYEKTGGAGVRDFFGMSQRA